MAGETGGGVGPEGVEIQMKSVKVCFASFAEIPFLAPIGFTCNSIQGSSG